MIQSIIKTQKISPTIKDSVEKISKYHKTSIEKINSDRPQTAHLSTKRKADWSD